jgi:hypothetical protein
LSLTRNASSVPKRVPGQHALQDERETGDAAWRFCAPSKAAEGASISSNMSFRRRNQESSDCSVAAARVTLVALPRFTQPGHKLLPRGIHGGG